MSVPAGGRSPAYPYLDLQKAVGRIQSMYAYAKRNDVNISGLYKHWGFEGETSSAKKTLAALKYYGLIEQSGKGAAKVARISDRGIRILLDHEGSDERTQAIRQAALSPSMYKYCWDTWGYDLPHDDAMRSHLLFNKGFNESTVSGFIGGYKRTIRYANLPAGGYEDVDQSGKVSVGDWVQWESQGIYQFPQAQKVREINEDAGFLFVEGSETGVPIDEVTIEEPPVPPPGGSAQNSSSIGFNAPPAEANMRQETFTLSDSEILIQFPSTLTAEDFEDFESWLEIFKRKVRRSIKEEHPQEEE